MTYVGKTTARKRMLRHSIAQKNVNVLSTISPRRATKKGSRLLVSTRPTPRPFWSPKTGTSALYTACERISVLQDWPENIVAWLADVRLRFHRLVALDTTGEPLAKLGPYFQADSTRSSCCFARLPSAVSGPLGSVAAGRS